VAKLYARLQAELAKLFRHVNMQRKTKVNFFKALLLVGNKNKFLKVQVCKRMLACKVKFGYLSPKLLD